MEMERLGVRETDTDGETVRRAHGWRDGQGERGG